MKSKIKINNKNLKKMKLKNNQKFNNLLFWVVVFVCSYLINSYGY